MKLAREKRNIPLITLLRSDTAGALDCSVSFSTLHVVCS